MTIIVDAPPIVAVANDLDPNHHAVANILRNVREPLIIPAPVTAEIDYLLLECVGYNATRVFHRELAAERFRVECLEPHEYTTAIEVDRRNGDLRLGLADLSIILLARRFDTRRLLTFDQRHFRAVEPLQGGEFTLLPLDDA